MCTPREACGHGLVTHLSCTKSAVPSTCWTFPLVIPHQVAWTITILLMTALGLILQLWTAAILKLLPSLLALVLPPVWWQSSMMKFTREMRTSSLTSVLQAILRHMVSMRGLQWEPQWQFKIMTVRSTALQCLHLKFKAILHFLLPLHHTWCRVGSVLWPCYIHCSWGREPGACP